MGLKNKLNGQLTTARSSVQGTKTVGTFGGNKSEVLILYIGGAGDKESYYGSGPFYNILDVKQKIESALYTDTIIDQSRYYCGYLGYNEACSQRDMERIVREYVFCKKNFQQFTNAAIPPLPIPNSDVQNRTDGAVKNLKIVIIGHSLGGWNGAHLAKYLQGGGHDVGCLMTIDPVGLGLGVRVISQVNTGNPPTFSSPIEWINVRLIGSGIDNMVAQLGERWIPGFEEKLLGGYRRTFATLPTYTYISKYSHGATWPAIYGKSQLIKVAPAQSAPRDNEARLPTLQQGELTPWDILKTKLITWLQK